VVDDAQVGGVGRLGRLECSFAGRRAAISLLVVLGVADGQKVLLAGKAMGGESGDWRSVLN
jgi:hypothetical protein